MTSNSSAFTTDETTEEFIEKEQEKFIGILQQSVDKGLITESFYTFAASQLCITEDWKEASEHYRNLYAELIEQGKHYVLYRLLERAGNGEEYNAQFEPHDIRHIKGRKLLDELYKQIEQYQRENPQHQPSNGHRNQSA